MGNNACKKAGIKPGATLGTKQTEALWARYDKGRKGFLPRDSAFQFLRDYAKALQIKYDQAVANELFEECDVDSSGTLDQKAFMKLCVEGAKGSVCVTDSLQLSVSGSDIDFGDLTSTEEATPPAATAPETSSAAAPSASASASSSAASTAASSSSAASSSAASSSAASSASTSAPARAVKKSTPGSLEELFDEYRGMNLSGEKMGIPGMTQLAKDLEISPNDLALSAFGWKCGCEGLFCHISKTEFIRGMKALSCRSIADLKKKLPALRREMESEAGFKDFYSFVFRWARGPHARVLPKDLAVGLWGILLPGKFTQLEDWNEYVKTEVSKTINRDTWDSLLEFANEVKNDRHMTSYVSGGFYPLTIDDFVDWYAETKAPQ